MIDTTTAPTRAHVSWIVGHGYFIDTTGMDDPGYQPTIVCMYMPPSDWPAPDRYVGQNWRHVCQLVRDYELCACGLHSLCDDSIPDPHSA
jgi:hypothetical protein